MLFRRWEIEVVARNERSSQLARERFCQDALPGTSEPIDQHQPSRMCLNRLNRVRELTDLNRSCHWFRP